MSIHTIGDSHSFHGWSGIINHHLGPRTCYGFGRDKLNRCDIRDYNINNGDNIVFCLGEIDCRCHVYKHINEITTYQDVINNLVENYFEVIKINIVSSQLLLKNICVYKIVPTIQKYNTEEYSYQPFLGSDEERKEYALYFNIKIKEKCIENNYIFFDIYDKYIDENGFLRKDLSDGNVHIRDGTYITNFIDKQLL